MLTRTIREMRKGQSGLVLPIVLVLLVLGGLLIVPVLRYGATSLQAHRVVEKKAEQLYAADSGVEDALYWLIHGKASSAYASTGDDSWQRDSYSLNAKTVDVEIEQLKDMGANIYKVTSQATGDKGSTTVLSMVWAIYLIEGDHKLGQQEEQEGPIYVEGDLELGQKAHIEGDVVVSGDVSLGQNSDITDADMFVDGDLLVEQHTSIKGGIVCVNGTITLEQNTSIEADVHFLGEHASLTIDQPNSQIVGNIWADGDLDINILQGNSFPEIEGNIYTPNGSLSIYLEKKNSEVLGDIYAEETFTIWGNGSHTGQVLDTYDDEPLPCPGFPPDRSRVFTWELS